MNETKNPISYKTRYVSAVEVAVILRKILKNQFPGVKFSVRSDRDSIDIKYTGGPSQKSVEKVASKYRGGGFDGMTDCRTHHSTWMYPDGTVEFAVYEAQSGDRKYSDPSGPGAELVSLGSQWVNVHREMTDEEYWKGVERFEAEYGWILRHDRGYQGVPGRIYQLYAFIEGGEGFSAGRMKAYNQTNVFEDPFQAPVMTEEEMAMRTKYMEATR